MQSRRAMLSALPALALSTLVIVAGCKEEVPSGRIKPAKVEIKVGETAHVELELPTMYDAVQREIWKVEPAELGEVYFDHAATQRRTATIRGKTAGEGKLVVHGFYRDAQKPYRIAEVPFTVK